MSETLYTRMSTQYMACSQRQIHTCIHQSVIHYSIQPAARRQGGEADVTGSCLCGSPCGDLPFVMKPTPVSGHERHRHCLLCQIVALVLAFCVAVASGYEEGKTLSSPISPSGAATSMIFVAPNTCLSRQSFFCVCA